MFGFPSNVTHIIAEYVGCYGVYCTPAITKAERPGYAQLFTGEYVWFSDDFGVIAADWQTGTEWQLSRYCENHSNLIMDSNGYMYVVDLDNSELCKLHAGNRSSLSVPLSEKNGVLEIGGTRILVSTSQNWYPQISISFAPEPKQTSRSPDGKWDCTIDAGPDDSRGRWSLSLVHGLNRRCIWSQNGEGHLFRGPLWAIDSQSFIFGVKCNRRLRFQHVDIVVATSQYNDLSVWDR